MGKTSKEVKARYQKRTYTRVEVQLHRELDKDIIDRLDEEPSRQGFFKEAAREKIAREGGHMAVKVVIDGHEFELEKCIADTSDGYSVYRTVDGRYVLHNNGGFLAPQTPLWELMDEEDFKHFLDGMREVLRDRPDDLRALLRDCGLEG